MKLVILCVLIGLVYSAPSPCIDLCGPDGDSNTKTSESFQSYRTHGTFDQNALHQSLINQLHNTHQADLKSTRPGNWTEHNDYVTDNGAGSVHEERGQLVNTGSKVNYYKRNYASSHGTGISDINPASSTLNGHSTTQSLIDRSNVQLYEQPSSYYNRKNSHSINHSSGSSIDNFARLENLGDEIDSQIRENSGTTTASNTGDNWSRHNSYATDGGRGKVYEEEGQFTRGPTKVRYHKKNYTSSFSTSNTGDSGITSIPIVTIPNINTNIDAQIDELKSHLEQVNSHIDQQTRHSSTSINNLDLQQRSNINGQYDHRTRNHISTNQNIPVANRVAVGREQYHERYSSTQNEHGTRNNYEPIESLPSQNHYVAPITQIQSTNTRHRVEKQIYVPSDINSRMNSHSNQQYQYEQHEQRHNEDATIRIPVYRRNDEVYVGDSSRNHLQTHQLNTNNNHENLYNQHFEEVSAQPQIGGHVEQHWSSSEHRSHSSIPQRVVVSSQHGINNGENLGLLGQQQYGSLVRGGYDNVNHVKSSNYIGGSSSSYHENYESGIHRGNVHSGSEHRYHGADCDDASQIQYNSEHSKIRYKREADYSKNNEDVSQQTDQTFGALEFGQQTDETFGKLELGQQTENNFNQKHESDLQQTQGHLGHYQTEQNQFTDYTQQQTENLGLEQQSTHGFEDYTQQHTGNLELGSQQTHHSSHRNQHEIGDYTQQSGKLELLEQHQPQTGQIEFGQQTENHDHDHYNHHHNSHGYADQDSTQQSTHGFEDYTQQNAENLEIGQHERTNGQLEFGQQTESHNYNQYRDRHAQQSGSLEFGQHEQQTHGNYYQDHTQQTEDLIQQSHQGQSFSEQSSRHDRFGQHQTDLSQQTENTGDSSQIYGNLEHGQQTQDNQDLSHVNEHRYGPLKPAPKPTPRSHRTGYIERGDIAIESDSSSAGVKGGRRRGPGHQREYSSHYSQLDNNESGGVLSLEQQIKKDESVNVFQPRILEAYGGNGPYDANHREDFYSDVKPNPKATLAPFNDGRDPWDVREVSANEYFAHGGGAETITESSTKLYEDDYTTTAAPGFWKKLGHKITNTYEKAKDKVSDVFG